MHIDLKKLFDNEGEVVFFSHDLDLTGTEQWGIKPFVTPVHIEGQAQNRAGIVTVGYTATFTTNHPCDRCLEPIVEENRLVFCHTVVRALNQLENDDYLVLPDADLDLDAQAEADILLELPIKVVCANDCKGLCPQCGANLNKTECGCRSEWKDPRFAALDKLL